MPAASDLFSQLHPISVWITLSPPETGEHAERLISLRVQQPPRRSVTVTAVVDIYSRESQILVAMAKTIDEIETYQGKLTHDLVHELLTEMIAAYVEPF
jgi:hypothetical protein